MLLRFAGDIGDAAFRRARAIEAELSARPPVGLSEVVPGFTTMLLRFDPGEISDLNWVGRYVVEQLAGIDDLPVNDAPIKEIPVFYGGDDLEELAKEKGMDVGDVVALHCEPVYRVYLLGFSPGFPYLGELNPKLHTPRKAVPRIRVTAGSVAIGGRHTGIYSVDSPGGWWILGHTNRPMFNRERLDETVTPENLFHLRAGDRVRFVSVQG